MSASLSGRVAALLAALAVLLVLLLGWFILISPERSKADDLQAQVADTQLKLDASKAYVSDPANKHIEADLKRLQNLLPSDVRMPQVLRQLSAASAVAGVRLDSITPTAATPGSTAEATPVSLTVVGHYFAISKFLQVLNAKAQLKKDSVAGAGRLYSASSLTLSKGASGATATATPDPNLLTATITLNVYSYGAGAAATTVPDSSTPSTDTTTTP